MVLGMKRQIEHPFEISHRPNQSEPMLWVADTVGWAYGRGGSWRRLAVDLDLIDAVIDL